MFIFQTATRFSRGHACRVASGLGLIAALTACGPGGPAPGGGAPAGVQAKVLQVAPQRVPIALESVAQVEGSKEVEVRARVAGILHQRIYAEGEVVNAGTPMFQIDPVPFEIALAQASAQLAQERARNEQASREAARLKPLAEQKAISQREYDDAATALKLSNATLQSAEARLREAELNLSYTLVKAPVSGVSGRAVRSEGSLISSGQDSLLTTINQVNPIWVRFSLSDSDLAKLPGRRLGRSSTEVGLVLEDGSQFPGKGRINFAATQIDPRLGTQQLRAQFDNRDLRLLPGQFVRVRLVAGQRDNVYLVPQSAVLQNEKGYFVFVLDAESKAAIRSVQPGEWVGTDWTILNGLNPNDRVIVDNLLKLQPGTQVTPAPAGTAPAK